LDGLRGVAILLVLVNHVVKHAGWYNQLGAAGVTLFFVLSGFLITSLLLEERSDTGRVSLRGFYVRRARRLLPALFVMLAALTAFLTIAGLSSPKWTLVPLLYASNWFVAYGHPPPFMGHTWSLSMEEQFYLLWPLLLIVTRRRPRALVSVCAAGIVAANVARVLMWDGGAGGLQVYYSPQCRADSILLGCLLAVVVHRYGMPRIPPAVTVAAIALVAVFGALPPRDSLLVSGVAPWLSAAAVTGCCHPSMRTGAALRWLGKRSYAVYLWLPLVSLAAYYRPGFPAALVGGVASLLVAEMSWRLVESRFLSRGGVGGDTGRGERGAIERALLHGASEERIPAPLRDT
jgi:peptidoglycan/LPS O-acetylase OafA/YrhL